MKYRKIVTVILVLASALASAGGCGGVVVVGDCSMERYEGRWELTGQDRDGHDLDGSMSIFPFIGDFRVSVGTRRGFTSDDDVCYESGTRVECGTRVMPDLSFFGSPERDCGTVVSLDTTYRDTGNNVTAIATLTFTSSRTATVRVESIPSRDWSPVTASMRRME